MNQNRDVDTRTAQLFVCAALLVVNRTNVHVRSVKKCIAVYLQRDTLESELNQELDLLEEVASIQRHELVSIGSVIDIQKRNGVIFINDEYQDQ